jgi:hypothetical protein
MAQQVPLKSGARPARFAVSLSGRERICSKKIIRKFYLRNHNHLAHLGVSAPEIQSQLPLLLRKLLTLCICLLITGSLSASDQLRIDLRKRTITADVDGWTLERTLSTVASHTGWQIYTEPGIPMTHPVSERFRDLPLGRALGRLLTGINFTFRPQTDGPEQLLIFRTGAGQATQALPDKSTRIRNELVVMLKPDSSQSIEEIAANLGAKVVGKIPGLNAYRLEFPYDNAMFLGRDALLRDDNVAGVDFNYRANPPPAATSFAATSRSLTIKPGSGPAAGQVIIGLVDTAVQLDAPNSAFLLKPISVAGTSVSSGEIPTHGTSMFESLLRGLEASRTGVNESSLRILPIDVYGPGESTTTFNMANGVIAALENGATIINISSGSSSDSELLHSAIRAAANLNVTVIASAGNAPTTEPVYPAAWPEVFAVTAGERDGTIADFANRGTFVDVVGPAATVVDYSDSRYLVTGTSPAAAYISGLAGGLAESAGASPEAIKAGLMNGLAPAPKSP